ncbi:MAG TPA: response regulator [Candidatus Krumholzibacteria bacterium]|nr:response regulator [Candidatus Krumholzibacteria bacterium]
MSETRTRLRALLVDDEELARTVLRELLATHADIEVAGECANGFEAVKAVSELQPDLVFLDIQMPKLNGFEVLELLDRDVAVVFVTAYDQYALRAFEVHAVDYLLKPFGEERLAAALIEARRRLQAQERLPVAALAAAARPQGPLERILIRDGARVHILSVEHIDYVEAQDDYVLFHSGGKKYMKHETLANLETQLDAKRFVRIHRSYLLHIERLSRVEPYAKDSRVAILQDGTKLPVSRAGYTRLSTLL